jgi:putative peptidoglycan lipid II flippase
MISAIFLSGWRGGIEGVAWGMLAATAVQFFVQIPAALKSVPPYQAVCALKHPTVRRLAAQTVPVSIRVAAHMVNHLVERSLASKLAAGSISALNFSFMVVQIPISIFGAPLVTVLNSVMAAFHSAGDADRYRRALVRGIRMISVVFIPLTMILILYRADSVQLLFQRGAFDQAAANLTADALAYYALGLLFFVWRAHAIHALIALKDFVTPVWTTLIAITANVACNLALVGPMDIGGIALGRSIGEVVWVLCLMGQLRRRLGPLGGLDILKSCGQIVLAAASAAAFGYVLRFSPAAAQGWTAVDMWAAAGPNAGWALPGAILLRLSVLGVIYIAVYTALCKLMKVAETDELIGLVKDYLKKRLA